VSPTRALRSLASLLLLLSLCGCGISADEMNDSGYRALAYELPEQADKYFDAARELIQQEVGEAGLESHPDFPRLLRGQLLVATWLERDLALERLREAVARWPDWFGAEDFAEQVRQATLADRPLAALAVAEYAARRFPEHRTLRTQRDNLRGRLGSAVELPAFDPGS
jgi:hypothetical protein